MKQETAKRLLDARNAATELDEFTSGHDEAYFSTDRKLQLAVHKLLEIIGEALNGARRSEPSIADLIPDLQRYVDLRNRIIHGYDSVDYGVLWEVARLHVPHLADLLDEMMQEAPPPEV